MGFLVYSLRTGKPPHLRITRLSAADARPEAPSLGADPRRSAVLAQLGVAVSDLLPHALIWLRIGSLRLILTTAAVNTTGSSLRASQASTSGSSCSSRTYIDVGWLTLFFTAY